MNKDLEIWQFAARKLKQNKSVILLVVAESAGSSPGRQGFKMIVAANETVGSVGGGAMEVRLVEQAKLKIQNSKFKARPEIVEQVHRKNSPDKSGMICSGRQAVVFYQLNIEHLEIVRNVIRAFENHQSNVLRISNSEFHIAEKQPPDFDFSFERTGENSFLYREKLGCKNKLFIVGGGHCALALSETMAKMDFYIALFDDRPNLDTFEKNRFADRKTVVESYARIGEYIPSGANHFVVVMTLGYQSDEQVIRELFEKNFKYFGVLGSRAKMRTLLRNLKSEGFDQEKLNRIRTPIGIEINSRTPEEIAVSIAAEIIRVKNAGKH